jgi:RNA polymerase sigma factor (sigma-70 family)
MPDGEDGYWEGQIRPMSQSGMLTELIDRVRAGDPAAAAELVRLYEPYVRRAVRVEMRDPRLRRVFDSTDFCQSVLASFFVRLAHGQYQLDRPEQLSRLLATMVRNKVASRARRADTTRRVDRSSNESPVGDDQLIVLSPEPSRIVAGVDLLQAVRDRLSEEEHRLSDLRVEGLSWSAIAVEVGENADRLRFRLTRALNRVAQELGLDDLDEG